MLVIGFDGAPYRLISRLIEQGKMPNLASMASKGVRGPLTSVLPPQSLPAWPSFASGMNPGKHGVYHFYKTSGGYNIRPCSSEDIRGITIWDYLTSLGRTSILVNVPLTYPPYEIKGLMVSGFPAPPGRHGLDGVRCYPESLEKEILSIALEYKMEAVAGDWAKGLAREEELLERLYQTMKDRTRVVIHLMKNPWDFFMVVYTCTDRVQHWFYRHTDPDHPAATAEGQKKFGQAIDDFFSALDTELGSILKHVDDSTTTAVLSDHGHSKQIAHVGVNQVLADIGMLKFHAAYRVGFTKTNIQQQLDSLGLVGLAQRLIPKKFRSAVPSGPDFSRSLAYCRCFGDIHVNLKGRDAEGIVRIEDYDRVRDDVIRLLLDYKDALSGEPIVEKVYKREEIYSGPFLENAPDLLAVFQSGYGPRTYNSNRKSIQRIDGSEFDLTKPIVESSGHHWFSSMDGIFFAQGPSIKKGTNINRARIIDVAPTILHLMGLAIPSNMDGKILDLFDANSEPARRKVEQAGEILATQKKDTPWSAEEEQAVMKRLADLGYMG